MGVKVTTVSGPTLERIRSNAEKAWINGASHIRGGDRSRMGPEDQLVGQLGEYAIAKYFGVDESYFARREEINRNPYVGDGGSDLVGFNVDVKTSLMRASSNPMKYNLLVRPKELHADTAYVLALVADASASDIQVRLVGFAWAEDLPDSVETAGVFRGAYRVPATHLKDVCQLKPESGA